MYLIDDVYSAMEHSSILIIVNSLLLSVSSAAFLLIGYFLKDLYQDYKKQIDRTNQMHTELNMHVKLFQELTQLFQQQMDGLQQRIRQLEQEKIRAHQNEKKQH